MAVVPLARNAQNTIEGGFYVSENAHPLYTRGAVPRGQPPKRQA
jgi:hypothetical protein